MASALEESALRGLAAWRDPEGVLSLYVNAEPERHRRRQPPFARAARDAIDRLVEGVREPSASRRLRQRIEALAPELDELLALGEHGSGRALFSRVGSGVTRTFALQHPLPDAAWLRQQPVLQPLLRAAQDGRAAGIVSVSRHGLRLVDWRFGVADELGRVDFGDPGDEWQKLPPGERGAHTPNAGPQRDLFHRRALHEAERALAEAGGAVGHTAQERGWRDLVLVGERRLTDRLAAALPADGAAEVLFEDRSLEWGSADELSRAAEPLLREVRSRRDDALVAEIQGRALAGGRGVLGAKATRAALEQGRVEHLVVATPDGDDEAEELIREAFATDARATVLTERSSTALAQADGVGALLRW